MFFAIIMAYSFIIGKNGTVKIIIASYIAILTADGLGNLVGQALERGSQSSYSDAVLSIGLTPEMLTSSYSLIVIKIITFVMTIVLLTTRGKFGVMVGEGHSTAEHVLFTALFGLLAAGLIVSTILVYMTGGSFVLGATQAAGTGGIDITNGSILASLLTEYYSAWFALPAVAFVVASLTEDGESHEE